MVDYYLIFAVRKINARRLIVKQAKIIDTSALKFYDKPLFLDELSTIYWGKTFAATNGNMLPLKCIKIISHHAHWITAELNSLLKELDLTKMKSEKDVSYWSGYKRLRDKVTY